MYKELLDWIEKEIVGVYDNDAIQKIIDYLQKRHDMIEEQLKEED